MSGQISEAVYLAWRDWKYETLISLCSVLALASMLAPILILLGLKTGITTTMRERLLEDPTTLVITPKSDAGRFTPDFIKTLAKLPGAAYAVGRTRATATDLTLENPAQNIRATIALEPATPGEPVLAKLHMAAPKDGQEPQLVLSTAAAHALKAQKGEIILAKLGRRTPEGRLESHPVTLEIANILPPEAADRRIAFAPLNLLEDMEKYRDYIAVPERGFSGNKSKAPQTYASFRLYANNLDSVEKLANALEKRHIETITRSRDIAAIQNLEQAINQIIIIISLAVGAGFAAFTLSSAEGAVRRKKRMLGMLRLLGFRRMPLMCYPITQTMLTAICGFALSILIYAGVSKAIAIAFANRGGLGCSLTLTNAIAALLIVCLLSALAAARSAWQAAALEPSAVIREV